MARKKIPGVYMLKNKVNGMIYIGESSDVRNRIKRYAWLATSDAKYAQKKRVIDKAIQEFGLKNFSVTILACGPEYADKDYRLMKEAEFIVKYDAYDPHTGYNATMGYEPCVVADRKPRKQGYRERLKRAKAVFSYDTKTHRVLLFLGGAKAAGKFYGYGKDVASHTVKRGSALADRYFLIPAKSKDRNELIEKLRAKKTSSANRRGTSVVKSTNAFNRYMEAVEYVEDAAREFGIE